MIYYFRYLKSDCITAPPQCRHLSVTFAQHRVYTCITESRSGINEYKDITSNKVTWPLCLKDESLRVTLRLKLAIQLDLCKPKASHVKCSSSSKILHGTKKHNDDTQFTGSNDLVFHLMEQ